MATPLKLSVKERGEILATLQTRFEKNPQRHPGVEWSAVKTRLDARPEKLGSLQQMEITGGEPDLVGLDPATGECRFVDCSKETPKGRTRVCSDRGGMDSRKKHKPADTAVDMAAAMGVEILTEEHYRELQQLGEFDTKTSSWVKTPADIRKLGGALFCDRRYGQVFVYHNGAQSYYGARAFRGLQKV